MKINSYHGNQYNSSPYNCFNTSFKGAADISLKYIQENRIRLLPQRMRTAVKFVLDKYPKTGYMPTLRELHLKTYAPLLECKTLGKAQNLFPEFREILQTNTVITKGSKNIRTINEHIDLKDLSLYILKERWGKLKTLNEVAELLGLKNRSALGWLLEKIRMPDLGKNYQALLKASDENLNKDIAEKVKAFNRLHPEKIVEHNRLLAQRPEIIQMNKELAEEMWLRMPDVREEMSKFRRDNPELSSMDFYDAFWKAHPEYKLLMSKIRKEIGAQRRKTKHTDTL